MFILVYRNERGAIFTVPNCLSLLRIFLIPVFFFLLIKSYFAWTVLVLVISSLSDYLDGFLARKLGQVTILGAVLDPLVDRLYIFATLLGLLFVDLIPLWFLLGVVCREIFLLTLLPVLRKHGYKNLAVHFPGKVGTFCLLCAFPLFLLSKIGGQVGDFFDIVAWAFAIWGLALYWFSAFLYTKQTWNLVHFK